MADLKENALSIALYPWYLTTVTTGLSIATAMIGVQTIYTRSREALR